MEQAVKKLVFQTQEVVFHVVEIFAQALFLENFYDGQDCRLFNNIWVQTGNTC